MCAQEKFRALQIDKVFRQISVNFFLHKYYGYNDWHEVDGEWKISIISLLLRRFGYLKNADLLLLSLSYHFAWLVEWIINIYVCGGS